MSRMIGSVLAILAIAFVSFCIYTNNPDLLIRGMVILMGSFIGLAIIIGLSINFIEGWEEWRMKRNNRFTHTHIKRF
jgi:hypothetical protein